MGLIGDESREFQIVERPEIPALGMLFGTVAMVPFVLGAAGAWLLPEPGNAASLRLSIMWAGGILTFLAGVRRGLSFRAPHADGAGALATMFVVFVLAFVALVLAGQPIWSLSILLIGYAMVAILDPIAARSGDAPLFFARLRPLQMMVPLASLAALLWRVLA